MTAAGARVSGSPANFRGRTMEALNAPAKVELTVLQLRANKSVLWSPESVNERHRKCCCRVEEKEKGEEGRGIYPTPPQLPVCLGLTAKGTECSSGAPR
uniref:Uncharacterized protein n=1 Tax=Vespula pensylvanica TaxID=30213 RepID=A0A834PBM3_VESPE|nr:hypothetical protein H0235_003312 [Vespula pensylvanica]